jgi:hypothetical protein
MPAGYRSGIRVTQPQAEGFATMLDPQLQARFAKSCGDAAMGYAIAATSAYTDIFSRWCDFWLDALRPASDSGSTSASSSTATTTTTASTGRLKGFAQPCAFSAPAFSFPEVSPVNAMAAWTPWLSKTWGSNPWAAAMPNPWAVFGNTPSPMTPFNTWMEMLQGRGSARAMPMAFAMISCGVPSGVAWPTAEANMAALDAAQAAKDSVDTAFSSYHRSGGGHASTPVLTSTAAAPVTMMLGVAPIGFDLLSMWLPFWRAATQN